MEDYELVIVGAGVAGLAAGIYSVRSGLKTLVIEEKLAGGTVGDAPTVENYLGFEKISGAELVQRMVGQARKIGVTIHEFEAVKSLDLKTGEKTVQTDKASYKTKAVIFATGSEYRSLGVPGEEEFRGKGVSYCGLCDGPLFKGKKLLVVGGGNSAAITALYLAGIASEVKIVHRRDAFRAEDALVEELKRKPNMEMLYSTELMEVRGDRLVRSVILFNDKSNETRELAVDGVFIQVGECPNSKVASEAGIAVNEYGNVIVDSVQKTNVMGVFAAGDVTNHPVKQIGTAAGQGITAATEAYAYIRRPYYRNR